MRSFRAFLVDLALVACAIVAAGVLLAALMALGGYSPQHILLEWARGAVGTRADFLTSLKGSCPLILTGLAAGVAFRSGVFNIGADRPYTVNELAHLVARAMGTVAQIEYLPARLEVANAYSCHAKIESVLGHQPIYALEEGLRNMAAWVRQFGARKSKAFEGIEVMKNFPSGWL